MRNFEGVEEINYMNNVIKVGFGYSVEDVLRELDVDKDSVNFDVDGKTLYITYRSGTKG